jgi:colicin import membrane protein
MSQDISDLESAYRAALEQRDEARIAWEAAQSRLAEANRRLVFAERAFRDAVRAQVAAAARAEAQAERDRRADERRREQDAERDRRAAERRREQEVARVERERLRLERQAELQRRIDERRVALEAEAKREAAESAAERRAARVEARRRLALPNQFPFSDEEREGIRRRYETDEVLAEWWDCTPEAIRLVRGRTHRAYDQFLDQQQREELRPVDGTGVPDHLRPTIDRP